MALHSYYSLKSLGFGLVFLQLVEILLGDASSCISINRRKSKAFGLFWSIRRGYPLAPTLYILFVEGFVYFIIIDISSSHVRGIYLLEFPNQLVNGNFVDDSFLTLIEDKKNVSNIL